MKIFVLSQQYPDLAMSELIIGLGLKKNRVVDNIVIADTKQDYRHLAYTNQVVDVISKLKDSPRIKTKTYCVRKIGSSQFSEKQVADRLNIQGKVDLANPEKIIGYATIDNITYVGILWTNQDDFESRKPHKRPVLHPSSLDPRLARACVNLLGTTGTILDPFCGTGGILIEAGLTGHNIVGYDLSEKMLMAAKTNLAEFGLNGKLEHRDAFTMPKKYKNIVTDMPYGRNTGPIDTKIYNDFIMLLRKNNSHGVVMIPDGIISVECRNSFKIYLHKSLSKRIFLI